MTSYERKIRRVFTFHQVPDDVSDAFLSVSQELKDFFEKQLDDIKAVGGISAMLFEHEGEIGILMMSSYTEDNLEYISSKDHLQRAFVTGGFRFYEEVLAGHFIFVLSSFAARVSEEVYAEKQRRNARRHREMLLKRHSRIGDTTFRDRRAGI